MQRRRKLEELSIDFNNRALNKKRIILPNAKMILFQDRDANADCAKD